MYMSMYTDSGSAQITITTVQSVLTILCIAGNSLVCVIIIKNQNMRTAMNYLLMNLAVADMMVATFFAPQYIFSQTFTHPVGVSGTVLCRLLTGSNLGWIGGAVSVFTLVAIATERYYAVMFPHGNKGKLTYRKLKVIIPCSWMFGVVMIIPVLLVQTFDQDVNHCLDMWPKEWMGKAYSVAWFLFTAFLPVFLMVAMYSRVVYALWFKRTELTSEQKYRQQGVMKVRKRVTLMVITVSVIYGVCWLTESIYYMLSFCTLTYTQGDVRYVITSTMVILNSAINPFVYGLVNQRFREKAKEMICCVKCHSAAHRVHPARETQRMEIAITPVQPTFGNSRLKFKGVMSVI